jgi:hypothetical protein
MSDPRPNFAIVSLSRSGSTALYRILSLDADFRIAYEPDFGDAWRQVRSLSSWCRELFSEFQGIKHVWDPNGWPFTNKFHQSTTESLSRSAEWIGVNVSLLDCVQKVVFLRRRNQLARVLSDLLGQQTGLWGHDPERPHSGREAVEYREQLNGRSLRQLDEDVIAWYLENASVWEDEILSHVPDARLRTVYFEDLFDCDVDVSTRAERLVGVADWLGERIRTDDDILRAILHPDSRFNDRSSYDRIPNIREIESKFGTF